MPTITYDRDLSNEIRTNLQKYWRENVYNGAHTENGTGSKFDENHFICRHQEACKQSCAGYSLQAAEATRFGDFYALEVDGKPLRIVIAGISISDAQGGQRAYNNTIPNAPIEHPKAQEIGSLNNQVKGTMLALQLLFGKQPYVNQFRKEDHNKLFTVDIENVGTRINLLQCYTLANRLLCSVRGGTSKGATTPPMRLNCKEHTLSILKILDPTILILQGTGVWSSIIDSVIREYLPNTPIHRFYHPAREWFSHEHTHFKAKVAPALVPVGEEYGFAPCA